MRQSVPIKGTHRPHLVQMDLEVAEPDVLETCAKAAVDRVLRAQSNRLELLVRRVPSGQVHREVIRGHQGSSGVIRGHQGSSEVISGHQRPSFRREALRAAEDQCEGSSRWLRYQLGVATPAFFMYKSHGARHMQASAYTACTSASRGYASATCAIAVM